MMNNISEIAKKEMFYFLALNEANVTSWENEI
jgi:hypothetical protein